MNPNSAAVAAANREMALAVLEQAIPIVLSPEFRSNPRLGVGDLSKVFRD
jgi:hypothetical protein